MSKYDKFCQSSMLTKFWQKSFCGRGLSALPVLPLAALAEEPAAGGWLQSKEVQNPITLSGSRSRLDQRRFSRPNTHFAVIFKIYKKYIFRKPICKICANLFQNFAKLRKFSKSCKVLRRLYRILQNLVDFEKFLKNVILDTKICEDLL